MLRGWEPTPGDEAYETCRAPTSPQYESVQSGDRTQLPLINNQELEPTQLPEHVLCSRFREHTNYVNVWRGSNSHRPR